MSLLATNPARPAGLPEQFSKAATLATVALALPLQLWVDPAVGWALRLAAAVAFGAALLCGRRWQPATLAVAAAAGPILPALLTPIVHVAALNAFYSVWLAAMFGALLPLTPRRSWALPDAWRLPLGVWAMTLALAWPIMLVREAGLRLGTLRDTGLLASWADLSTPQVESWILHVVLAQLVGLLWLERACAWGSGIGDQGSGIRDRAIPDPRSRIPDPFVWSFAGLWIGASLAGLVAIYQGTVDMSFLSGGPWPGLRRAAGTLLDANAYGTIAALGGPLAFVGIPRLRLRHARAVQASALALNWAGAWVSGSRTAIACGAFGTLALVYQTFRASRRDIVGRRETPSLFAGVAALVLLVVLAAGAAGPLERLSDGLSASGSLGGLWRRGGYGTVAVRMVRDYPLTGVGVGTFNWMAPDYWRLMANDPLPFDNAQNWWRHQVAELGLVASLPVLIWSLLVGWLVVTRRSRSDSRVEAETLRGLLVGIGVASLFGMPTQNPIVLLTFFYVVGRFEGLTRPAATRGVSASDATGRQPWQRLAWAAGTVIAIGYAAGHMVLARGPLKPLERAVRTHRDFVVGTYPLEGLDDRPFRWTGKRGSFVLQATSPYLIVRYRIEHPDAASNPVRVTISTPCQTLVDEFRDDASVGAVAVKLGDGQSRIEFETNVSRTWRPSSVGRSDTRDLGAAVEADFAGTPSILAPQQWVPLRPCGSI